MSADILSDWHYTIARKTNNEEQFAILTLQQHLFEEQQQTGTVQANSHLIPGMPYVFSSADPGQSIPQSQPLRAKSRVTALKQFAFVNY